MDIFRAESFAGGLSILKAMFAGIVKLPASTAERLNAALVTAGMKPVIVTDSMLVDPVSTTIWLMAGVFIVTRLTNTNHIMEVARDLPRSAPLRMQYVWRGLACSLAGIAMLVMFRSHISLHPAIQDILPGAKAGLVATILLMLLPSRCLATRWMPGGLWTAVHIGLLCLCLIQLLVPNEPFIYFQF